MASVFVAMLTTLIAHLAIGMVTMQQVTLTITMVGLPKIGRFLMQTSAITLA